MRNKSTWIVIAWLGLAASACVMGGTNNGVPTSTPTLQPTLLATNTPLGAQDTTIPTLVPTLASGGLVSDATQAPDDCQTTYHSRLAIGRMARVLPGLPNSIRSQPVRDATRSNVIGTIPAGGTFEVMAGPSCDSGLIFWQINYQNTTGWTAEADATTYYVEPINGAGSALASTDCPGSPAARLSVGANGQVMPGDPNILRNDAGLSATVVGRLAAGSVFAVIGGPNCVDNLRWWQINFNGQVGWTVEGQGNTYWLEPAG